MWRVTQDFIRALGTSRQLVVEADLLDGWVTARPIGNPFVPGDVGSYIPGDSAGTLVQGLPVVGGSLTRSLRSANYAQLSLMLAEPIELPRSDLQPMRVVGSIGPDGYEIALRAGLILPDGTKEMVPLGVFPIQASDVDGVHLSTSLTLGDRAVRISEQRFEEPWVVSGGSSYRTEIYEITTSILNSAKVDVFSDGFDDTIANVPPMVFEERSDPWEAIQTIAGGIGAVAVFDGNGDLRLRSDPSTVFSDPVWEVSEGEGGALLAPRITHDRRDAVNRVIATSANASLGTTYRSVATDLDPTSQTYYYGRFGKRTKWFTSPAIGSSNAAVAAAEATLRRSLGVPFTMTLESLPNPALVPGDMIAVLREELNIRQNLRVDSITLGLGPEDSTSLEVRLGGGSDVT